MTRYPSLRIEGGLIGSDIIDQIADGEAPGQKPGDFGLKGQSLMDEIAAVWAEARKHWEAFQHRLENLPSDDPFATRTTRSQWIIPPPQPARLRSDLHAPRGDSRWEKLRYITPGGNR